MTRADILQRAHDALNTTSLSVLDIHKLYRAYNDVQREFAIESRCLSSETAVTLTLGQQTYQLAAPTALVPKAFEVRRVRCLTAAGSQKLELEYTPLDAFPQNYEVSSGTPTIWGTRGTLTVVLWPVPGTTIASGLCLDTYNLPTELTENSTADTTALEFPDSHRTALVLLTAARLCKLNLEDPTLSARLPLLMAEYREEMAGIADREQHPSGKPIKWGGTRRVRRSDRWSGKLPNNYGLAE